MQKMKSKLYNKIIQSKDLSKIEIHFLFVLASCCNETGWVIGVYYKNIAKILKCDESKFYQLRDSLTDKGFIRWEKNFFADIDIQLIDNDFLVLKGATTEAEYKDYIDLNINIFQDEHFFECKAGAIRLAMELIKRVAADEAITLNNSPTADKKLAEDKRKLWYLPYNLYKKMSVLLEVKQRMIKKYLTELQPWISIVHKVEYESSIYDVVTVKKSTIERPKYECSTKGKRVRERTYAERSWYIFYINSYCRRNKITEDDMNLSDTADLIKQYRDKASKRNLNIMHLICKAIKNTTSSVLNSISVHKALINLINYQQSEFAVEPQ